MMDFDKDFERFLAAWYARLSQEAEGELSADEVLELAPDVYGEWADAPNTQLGGISPRAFFASIDSPEKLLELFVESPCALLYDRIAQIPACADGLIRMIEAHESADTRADAVELLHEMGLKPPVALYVRIVANAGAHATLGDRCTEILSEYAEEAAPLLYELIDSADETGKARIAEVLLHAPKDVRTLALLKELFQTGNHTAQYAGYLAKYGDSAAAQMLYERLGGAGHYDYIELRNAIEALGGVVDD